MTKKKEPAKALLKEVRDYLVIVGLLTIGFTALGTYRLWYAVCGKKGRAH